MAKRLPPGAGGDTRERAPTHAGPARSRQSRIQRTRAKNVKRRDDRKRFHEWLKFHNAIGMTESEAVARLAYLASLRYTDPCLFDWLTPPVGGARHTWLAGPPAKPLPGPEPSVQPPQLPPLRLRNWRIPVDRDFGKEGPRGCAGSVLHCALDAANGGSHVFLARQGLPEDFCDEALSQIVAAEPWHGGDPEIYGGTFLPALPFMPFMQQLTELVFAYEVRELGDESAEEFGPHNEAQIGYYPDGRYSLSLHSDHSEQHRAMFQPTSIVVAVLGPAARLFAVELPDGRRLELVACHGDLVFMTGMAQLVSRHGVPADPACRKPRYSVSLRRDFTAQRQQ